MPSEQTPKTPGADNRKTARRRVLKSGIIAFNDRHSTLQCTVRDLSEGGARLLISGSFSAPDTFELIIDLDGLEASCAVVTRTATEVRVKFVGPVRSVPAGRVQIVKAVGPKAQPTLRRKPRLGE